MNVLENVLNIQFNFHILFKKKILIFKAFYKFLAMASQCVDDKASLTIITENYIMLTLLSHFHPDPHTPVKSALSITHFTKYNLISIEIIEINQSFG